MGEDTLCDPVAPRPGPGAAWCPGTDCPFVKILAVRRVLNTVGLALAIYGFAAWGYVALVALIQPQTLAWRLTHLASWPRTDTFGEISFVVSFLGFIVFRLTS